MSTRSDIIVELNNGKWHRIYCHSDGYLSHNGRILFDHYTDQKHVEELVALGDLSSLGKEIGEKHPFDGPAFFLPGGDSLLPNPAYEEFKKRYGDWCRAYGRDRGQASCEGTIGDTIQAVWPEADCWTEFTYVWTEGQWFVADPDTGSQALVNLGDALSGKITVTPSVKAFGMILGQHKAHDPKEPERHAWTGKKPKDVAPKGTRRYRAKR